ncbi:MAG: methylmalonate-semialdehyde dehydrogenase (CoA acylating) [Deltaproteobacteria bacterium]|nr:MAG: methylmalonate-semialdehyde dehydrogenase (CoA acylating) [Deltaproteobacteria bacterium]
MSNEPIKLKYYVNGEWLESKTDKYMDCYNPSTGEVIARAPQCTQDEVAAAIQAAVDAFPGWAATPVTKRAQVLFKMKALVDKNFDELVRLVATEQGKNWGEAVGCIAKMNEVVEFASGISHLMKGQSIMNITNGYDTVQYMEPLGVFAGIAPWNFPAMIPHGWMTPLAVATGNTFVLKPASAVPQSAMRILDLWAEAGLPRGVINLTTCGRNEAEIFLKHPDIKGVSFVGSTSVGRHIYATAAGNGKRVQALCEAKNHALVLRDCNMDQTIAGISNATCGCAGERCMALPVIVVENAIADEFVDKLVKRLSSISLGPAYEKSTGIGPVLNAGHKQWIMDWIEKGIQEGAKLVLDGRDAVVPGYENGFYIAPSVFDHVTPEMSIGWKEIFGPVTCIKRVENFEEGLALMNRSEFANGSAIYTQNGYFAREFSKRSHGGMVGINVGIPVPVGIFGFTGHKNSFFGDLHIMGNDGIRFFTEQKTVTSHWYDEKSAGKKVDTWDGMIEIADERK